MDTNRFEMRLDQKILTRIDRWRSAQPSLPSRADAVRHLMDKSLSLEEREVVQLSSGEKIILGLLIGLCRESDNGDDADFIEEAITGGHFWALPVKFRGLFGVKPDDQADVEEVGDILEMWDQIVWGYSKLSSGEKNRVLAETNRSAEELRFPGFDGNHEHAHLNIAKFMINRLGRFESISGSNLNSHTPTLAGYKVMVREYKRIRNNWLGEPLAASHIISILKSEQV